MHLAFCYLTSRISSENPTSNRPIAEYGVKIVMATPQAQGKAKKRRGCGIVKSLEG